jgi:hypothetical protein
LNPLNQSVTYRDGFFLIKKLPLEIRIFAHKNLNPKKKEYFCMTFRYYVMHQEKFIFCLEGVPDTAIEQETAVIKNLEKMAFEQGLTSIYKTCDTIEGLEESLSTLLYDDNNFQAYEIIYLVMPGEANSICLNDYFYSLEEIAELFEGKMKGKIIHFANAKALDLDEEEAQYFLDITGARAVSGYGLASTQTSSHLLDKTFFDLCQKEDDITDVVESLFEKQYALCQLLDFRLYY